VSLTGGEPLLQPEACLGVARRARDAGLRVMLETHGLAVEALGRVVDQIDVVSMDWKLASDVETAAPSAHRDFATRHRAFLETAARAAERYVKVVVTDRSTDEEFDEVCDAVAEIAPDVPLILQPVTPFGRVQTRPDAARLLTLLRRCETRLADVRLIPQTHPIYGAR
jgi:7-carboxy-7-deazaguanine synthase